MRMKLVSSIIRNKNLILLGLTYFSFLSLFYLVEPIRKIILSEKSQTLEGDAIFIAVVLNLIILFLAYLLFFKKIQTISFKKLFILSIIINLFLWLIWPITSADIILYIGQGRVFSIFKENPYLFSYSLFEQDIFFAFLNTEISKFTSVYGPVLTLLNGLFSLIFKNNIILNLFGLKLFFIFLNILNGYLIYKISSDKTSFFLYAFNPLIIFELAINGHNDSVFVFFILIALYLLKKSKNNIKNNKKHIWSFFFLTLSVLTKFISIIFMPILALMLFLKEKNTKKKLLLTLSLTLVFFFTTLSLYYPFIEKWQDILIPLRTQSQIIGVFLSPLIILFVKILGSFSSFPLNTSILWGRSFFIMVYLYLIFTIIKNRHKTSLDFQTRIHILFGAALLTLLLSSFTWLMPWYFILLIALFSIIFSTSPKKNYFSLLIIFGSTFYGIINYLVLR